MGHLTPVTKVKRTSPVLLLVAVILTLGGCGGGTPPGQEETTSAETGAAPAGGETTSARTGRGGAVPDDVIDVTIALTPIGDSEVSGRALLADTSGGLEVTLSAQGLPEQPGAGHLAHIHEGGTCADSRAGNEAPVTYPLESVTTGQDGAGSSTTMIPDVTVVQLFSGAPKYIDVHAETVSDEVAPSVSCADIYTAAGGD